MIRKYENLIEGFEEEILDNLFVQRLVHSLPVDEVAIIAMKFSDEYTTEEMAEILGISTGTLWTRHRKALKTLQKKVKKL